MSPKVSIIVPVYNAGENLRRCIESALKQDFTDFELLLINDGSSDTSGEICDEYAAADGRVRVVHKENTGVSDSRNLAISLAQGEYLQFIDSDDWITPDATGLLVRTAEENHCEMVISDFYRVIGERLAHKGDIQEDGLLTREEFAVHMMEKPADFYYGVLWNKLYRRDLVSSNGLRMDENISWCEDFIFNMEYIRHVKTVYALHVPIYYYVKTPGSLVSQGASISKTIQMKRTVFKCYNEFYKDVFNEEDYAKRRLQVYRFLVDAASDGSVMPSILPGTMKLGNERVSVSVSITEAAGILLDSYRESKLLDRYLETVALRQELLLEDVKLLLYFSQTEESGTLKEISAVTHLKKTKILLSLQKLIGREILKLKPQSGTETEEKKNSEKNDKIEVIFLPGAEGVLADILQAEDMYRQVKYTGLSEEEIEQYEMLAEKIRDNVQNALK